MASPHELSSGTLESPYSVEVRGRSERIGDYHRKYYIKGFTRHLEELSEAHPELINLEALNQAAEVEGRKIKEAVVQEREAGLRNDDRSRQPGIFITGSLEQTGINMLRTYLEEMGIESTFDVDESSGSSEMPYRLHLPHGAFIPRSPDIPPGDQKHLTIVGAAEFDEKRSARLIDGYLNWLTDGRVWGMVGRIECSDGRLWQNPSAYPDGSPKPQTTERAG